MDELVALACLDCHDLLADGAITRYDELCAACGGCARTGCAQRARLPFASNQAGLYCSDTCTYQFDIPEWMPAVEEQAGGQPQQEREESSPISPSPIIIATPSRVQTQSARAPQRRCTGLVPMKTSHSARSRSTLRANVNNARTFESEPSRPPSRKLGRRR